MFGKTRTRDMTVGSPLKLLVSFVIPLMFGNAFQQLYTIVDTAVVGRFVSTEALAAVGTTGSINWFILGFVWGFTHGFSISISQAFGSGNQKRIRKTVIMSYYLAAIIALVITVLSLVATPGLLRLMGTPENLMKDAVLYISIIFGGSIFSILYNVSASVLRAFGNSAIPFWVLVFASLFNVAADFVFVLAFDWGVAGVAIATVMANVICVPVCLYFVRRTPVMKFSKDELKWDGKIAAELLKLGLPVGLMNTVTAFGMLILQFVVNSMGELTVAAYAVAHKVCGLADSASNVTGMALGTYVGQNIGAGNIKRTKRGLRTAFWMSNVWTGFLGAMMIIFRRPIVSLFVGAEETAVIAAAEPYIIVTGAMMWSLGLLFVYRYALQALGDTVVPMFSGILELAMRLSVVFLLPVALGFYRVSIAEVSAWFAAAAMLAAGYYVRIHRLSRKTELPGAGPVG